MNSNDIACIVESIISAKGYASGEVLNEVFDKITNLRDHLNCGVICGHEPRRFVKVIHGGFLSRTTYAFECEQCGLQITKSKYQLTAKERKALIGLGHDNLCEQSEEKK